MPPQHPFQCIQCLRNVGPDQKTFIVAAAGPYIYAFDAVTGVNTAVWPTVERQGANEADESVEGPPGKRRRLTPPAEGEGKAEEGESKEGLSKEKTIGGGKQKEAVKPSVTVLAVSHHDGYVVASTAEDKCVRVFQVDSEGRLNQYSDERHMPKRPSAITLPNTTTTPSILLADKFGDVFSLPLHYNAATDTTTAPTGPSLAIRPPQPAATNLTVHTKGNLRALQQQLEQAKKHDAQAQAQKSQTQTFPHTLLLGHVSMLTDIAHVALAEEGGKAGRKEYILTADRDEHIRVSRAPPQTHVIERYCFGHTAFVNRLCVPAWDAGTLVSGGGDGFLLVWDWREGVVRQRLDFGENEGEGNEVTVTGIWAVSFAGHPVPLLREMAVGAVLVALEGSPTLLVYLYNHDNHLIPQPPITLPGNALGLCAPNDAGTIMVAVDTLFKPGSTKDLRGESGTQQTLVQMFTPAFKGGFLEWQPLESPVANAISRRGTFDVEVTGDEKRVEGSRKAVGEVLYGASNLRKHGGDGNE